MLEQCREGWSRMNDDSLLAEIDLWQDTERGEALIEYVNRYRPNLKKELP